MTHFFPARTNVEASSVSNFIWLGENIGGVGIAGMTHFFFLTTFNLILWCLHLKNKASLPDFLDASVILAAALLIMAPSV